MEFRVLGGMEVESGGRLVPITGTKERALLALLLLHANEHVSRDLLIDALWGERPPATAKHTLETYVSRLRKTLAAGGNGASIETRPGGYRIRVDCDQLDVLRFERLLAEGRAALAHGTATEADEKLEAALELWRGDALADLASEPFAAVEAARLEELRLAAVETRVEAELALSRHRTLVAELQSLVATYPLRERLRAQLMLALYRCGRQADALDVYREGRGLLVDELGIEPGKELQELHAAILRQDAALDLPPARAPPDDREEPRPAPAATQARPVWRRPDVVIVLLALVALAAIVAGAVVVRSGEGDDAGPALPANAAGMIDPTGGALAAEVPVGARPADIALGYGAAWVVNAADRSVSRIDLATRRVVRTVAIPDGTPARVATGENLVWVSGHDGRVWAIDPSFDEIVDTIEVRRPVSYSPFELPPPETVAVGEGAVWVVDRLGYLSRVGASDRRVGARTDLATEANAVVVAAGSVWVAARAINAVLRVDSRTATVVDTLPVGKGPVDVTFGAGAIWVAAYDDGTVSRLDAKTGRETVILVGARPVSVAFAPGAVWVAREGGEVVRIDPRSNRVDERIPLRRRLSGIAAGESGVWVTTTAGEAT